MAGHNKWSKIKHRKAVVDKRRGKVWTKVSKAIIVAARHGGPDPASNLALRYAIDEARYANMPRDTIERAIKKGAGGEDTSQYETVRYEGYAPGGVAVVVDALTDNRTRTAADVRGAFNDHGGNLGTAGCVGYMFLPRGRVLVAPAGVSEDAIMGVAIEAGAADIRPPEDDGDPWEVLTDIPAFLRVKDAIESAGFTIEEASLAMVPEATSAVSGETADRVGEIIEALEELDDVQKVYTNADFR
ncbi:MAG: YebC/PmpR family DNA-binding transcriptional regulator [Phycisphaeraceae bacterium]|nr:MAG: YebC/PmpR family DNA-binding transcriptional regulator [Phycisphaeraceae bacterium]